MKINNCYYSVMNGRHRLFLGLFSELFVFFLSCLQFTVYSAVVCLTALQPFIKALLSIIWCSQLKLRKAFGVVWLILPPLTLFSSTEMFLVFFASLPGSVVIRRIGEIIYATRFSNYPRFRPGFPACCDFPMRII